MNSKRIVVLGAGHLGKIHLQQLAELPEWEVTGFYDPDERKSKEASERYGLQRFPDINTAISNGDAVDVVTPTLSHFELASEALRAGKHVFIEKPLTNTVAEGEELLKIAASSEVTVQVGHVERFNPAFQAAVAAIDAPKFIETHRLAQFNPRGTDVSVILDLMIHDLDITLSVMNCPVANISASGVAVVSDTPDIANARIEFENGCVANLTASRISMKNMRRSRFFQRDAYIKVDMLEKMTEIIRMKIVEGKPDPFAVTMDLGEGKGHREISFERPEVLATNAIREELRAFARSVNEGTPPPVTLQDGFEALALAHRILRQLENVQPS